MDFKIISSKENALIKFAKQLLDKKGRKEYGKMLIEGKKTIADLLKLNVDIEMIFCSSQTQEFVKNLNPPPSTQCVLCENNIINQITHQTTSQEVVAVVKIPKQKSLLPTTNFLVLDGLQDAGNIGTIMRTALATGFNTIYLIDCVDISNPKVVDSSMTAIFHLNLVSIDREEFIDLVKRNDLKLLSAELDGENACTMSVPCGIIGLVIGNEGNGVSDLVSKNSFKKITLPMSQSIESLNASVSAGILMYLIKMKNGEL